MLNAAARIHAVLRIDLGDGSRNLVDAGDGGVGGLVQIVGLTQQPVGGVVEVLRYGSGVIQHGLARYGVVGSDA